MSHSAACVSKIAYSTRAAAKRAGRHSTTGHRLTVYQCPHCGGWHRTKVTSARRWRGMSSRSSAPTGERRAPRTDEPQMWADRVGKH